MKKTPLALTLVALLLLSAMIFSLVGCGVDPVTDSTDAVNAETDLGTADRITSEQALEYAKNAAKEENLSFKMVYNYPCAFLDKGLVYVVYAENRSGEITSLFAIQPQDGTVFDYVLLTKEEALQIGKNLLGTSEYEVYYDEVGYTFDASGVPYLTVQAYTVPTQLPEADETYMRYTVATYTIHAVTGDVFDGVTGEPVS